MKDTEYANLSPLERIQLVQTILEPLSDEDALNLLIKYTSIVPTPPNIDTIKEPPSKEHHPKEDTTLKRAYNKKEDIMELFDKYHNEKFTKRRTFRKIAKELDVTWNAIEKIYYKSINTCTF